MACNSLSITTSPVTKSAKDKWRRGGLGRSLSSTSLCQHAGKMRRSCSDNNLCYSINSSPRASSAGPTKPGIKATRSIGMFNFHLSGSIIPNSIKTLLFEPETSQEIETAETEARNEAEEEDDDDDVMKKRANWIERLLEIRSRWRERQDKENGGGGGDDEDEGGDHGGCGDDYCEVSYDDEGEEEENGSIENINKETFSNLLDKVSWSDSKLFAQLAFLCNMAYAIPELKATDLRRYYALDYVTSSFEKKAEAAALKEKLEKDSTQFLPSPPSSPPSNHQGKEKETTAGKRLSRPGAVYEIAASAASYVHSRAKDMLAVGSESSKVEREGDGDNGVGREVKKSEVAAFMAASTMTAVVAAGEKERQEAAKDLQSLHSSPCEWFICDDPSTYTRCFVIQGSDSLASWQANLFFEPTKFEETDVLVHRGIYEAAKGIYEQFMPEIMEHLNRYGERAKLQFTGHSLGGSLSLLVNLMLLTKKVVKSSVLRPVVTFGSPFVFCGGQKILDELGLDEDRVHCVMMHRDIVPRAFACNYPKHVAQLLKRLNGSFRSHPCLNKNKLLYSPLGKMFILQPDEKFSPPHPLLPSGSGALYALQSTKSGFVMNSLKAFLNNPHPLVTLSNPTAYGSEGTILRDHDSSNYLRAMNGVIRQQTKMVVTKIRKQRRLVWPLLSSQSSHLWSQEQEDKRLVTNEVMSSV